MVTMSSTGGAIACFFVGGGGSLNKDGEGDRFLADFGIEISTPSS